jgi:hypothetical protein
MGLKTEAIAIGGEQSFFRELNFTHGYGCASKSHLLDSLHCNLRQNSPSPELLPRTQQVLVDSRRFRHSTVLQSRGMLLLKIRHNCFQVKQNRKSNKYH